MTDSKKIARHIAKQFKIWADGIAIMRGDKVTPRDFDCWFSGYIGGVTSYESDVGSFIAINWESISQYVTSSEEVKSIGVTGIEKESFEIIKV